MRLVRLHVTGQRRLRCPYHVFPGRMPGLGVQHAGSDVARSEQGRVHNIEPSRFMLPRRFNGPQPHAVSQPLVIEPQRAQVSVGYKGPVKLPLRECFEQDLGAHAAGVAHRDAEDCATFHRLVLHDSILRERGPAHRPRQIRPPL